MKNFVIAILLAVLISYVMGNALVGPGDISIRMDDELLSPMEAVTGITIGGALLMLAGFVLAISVIGIVLFCVVAVAICLFIAGVSAFWPIILVLAVIIYLVKGKRPEKYS